MLLQNAKNLHLATVFYYEKFDEPPEKRYIDDFLTNFSSQKFSYFKESGCSIGKFANVFFDIGTGIALYYNQKIKTIYIRSEDQRT